MRLAAIIMFAVVSATITQAAESVKGIVADSSGAVLPEATVRFHWDPAGSTVGLTSNVGIARDLVVKTDQQGRFKADLPPGFYDVFVSAMAFTPVCRKIRVAPTRVQELTFSMSVEPLYTDEFGFKIEAVAPKRKVNFAPASLFIDETRRAS